MPLTAPARLDFTKLTTPVSHGDVLIVPQATYWLKLARFNAETMRRADYRLLGASLAHWRKKIREAVVGDSDRIVVVTGHQPGFIHPGVWAKHIAAKRFAGAAGGVAVNFTVDSDAPKRTTLPIPAVKEQRVVLRHIPFAELPAGYTYEQIAAHTEERIATFEQAIREALADGFADSQMPAYFEAKKRATNARDWVDQVVAGRRAVEARFGIVLEDRRVSRCRSNPLLLDMILHGPRFAASYNRALASYRRENRIRGSRHPIPDLAQVDNRCELPVWAQPDQGIRERLFVSQSGDIVRLYAGDAEIGEFSVSDFSPHEDLSERLIGWQLRPRALTLTMWLRLLLADLFVHGIGGAKYDRISDAIMADYYGITPPHMVCVSATLLLDLPVFDTTHVSVRRLTQTVRDLRYNPQRNLPTAPDLADLTEQRAEAVDHALELRRTDPRNHHARRTAYHEIRALNAAFLEARPDAMSSRREALAHALDELEQARIARGREYFFGLYDQGNLERLLGAVPAEGDFRV